MKMNNVMSLNKLTKQFPGVLAVDGASLEIESGKIHAIVGGNGAGKSTLIKILSGIYPVGTYGGDFYLEGTVCRFKNVLDAEQNGIALVPQDLNMVNDMTVADNLFIAKQPTKYGFINQKELFKESQSILDDFGLTMSPGSYVKEIGIAQKQLLVIARAMHNKVKVLILDEPTSTLSSEESKLLFSKIVHLREKGISCIYISHRLEEVSAISDTITVMRDGKIVCTDKTSAMSERRIVSLMVGKDVEHFFPKKTNTPTEVVMEANHVSVYSKKSPDKKIVEDASFTVRKGEILALYGLVGSGRTEMAQGLTGAWQGAVEYELKIDGNSIVNKNPAHSMRNGISLLPEDRKREGVINVQSVGRNITASSLASFARYGILNTLEEYHLIQKMIDSLSIKTTSKDVMIETLSGGNQQKVILSRLILADPTILILDEATQGIDIEAKSQIYSILNTLAMQGKAILFISSDIAEVMGVADRIMIMREGKIIKTLENKNLDKEKVLWYATVGNKEAV